MVVKKRIRVATKDVLDFIGHKKVARYLDIRNEFCPNVDDVELKRDVGHKIRQILYIETKIGKLKRVDIGKYKIA